jgi:hypothetical protein
LKGEGVKVLPGEIVYRLEELFSFALENLKVLRGLSSID